MNIVSQCWLDECGHSDTSGEEGRVSGLAVGLLAA